MPSTTLLPLLAGLLSPSALLVPAQEGGAAVSAPQVQAQCPEFVSRLADLCKRPFECDVKLHVSGDDGSASGSGHIVWSSTRLFAVELRVDAQEAGGDTEQVQVKLVADGTHLNAEFHSGEGATQAVKVGLDLFRSPEALKAVRLGGDADLSKFHEILSKIEFQEEADESVRRYRATLDAADLGGGGEGTLDVTLTLGAATWFPQSLEVTTGDGVRVELSSGGVKFPESIAAERFRYQAPEGVQVQDITPMLRMMIQASGGEEDEEF